MFIFNIICLITVVLLLLLPVLSVICMNLDHNSCVGIRDALITSVAADLPIIDIGQLSICIIIVQFCTVLLVACYNATCESAVCK